MNEMVVVAGCYKIDSLCFLSVLVFCVVFIRSLHFIFILLKHSIVWVKGGAFNGISLPSFWMFGSFFISLSDNSNRPVACVRVNYK